MAAIFEGVDELIDRSLRVVDVGKPPHHRHKASALRLSVKPYGFNAHELCQLMLKRIEQNWTRARSEGIARIASQENWRWEKQTYISAANSSQEKLIEKAIAVDCDDSWVNQVPTASGLMDSTSERHCNIDLIHQVAPREFEFIELKFDSDTPVFATLEILKYSMVYLFSRNNAAALGYSLESKPLLAAESVHLCVLAPYSYFSQYTLQWLQTSLNQALSEPGLLPQGLRMDFRFEYHRWPVEEAPELVASRRPLCGTLASAHRG